MQTIPFKVQVSDAEIADLRARLARTRWADQLPEAGWAYGTERVYLQSLCDYWRDQYDFTGYAARLNAFPQFLTEIDGERLHFYHVRSPEPGAHPLVLLHGWPGSVVEFLDVVRHLTDPRANGGDPGDAFHIVLPSLPGYGYSGPTRSKGVDYRRAGGMVHQLMLALGYDRYFAQGGDWGALTCSDMAERYPTNIVALHLNMAPGSPANPKDPTAGLSAPDAKVWSDFQSFMEFEFAYAQIQSTRPQTLAYGLNDSPAGLAGWLMEKFYAWSDVGETLNEAFGIDRLLDNITLYWLSGTINSSCRLYFETNGPPRTYRQAKVTVPTGVARFAGEPYRLPRAWVEHAYNVVEWKELPKGGHFAAFQRPDDFLGVVRDYFRRWR